MERNPPKELSFWVLFAIAFVVVALWVGAGVLLYDANESTPILGERGTFGDMFGSINALFSGLAFAGIIFTVLLQRQELQLQRHELKLQREEIIESRKELTGQRQQLEQQSQTFFLQRFEGTFFQLFNQFRETARTYKASTTKAEGKVGFQHTLVAFKGRMRIDQREGAQFEENINRAYAALIEDPGNSDLVRYYKALFSVLSFIDRAKTLDARFYSNLVRSELSQGEVILLAYIGLTDIARPKLKPLIERYTMLKHIPNQVLFENIPLLKAYSRSAFKADLPTMLSTHLAESPQEEPVASQPKD